MHAVNLLYGTSGIRLIGYDEKKIVNASAAGCFTPVINLIDKGKNSRYINDSLIYADC